MMDPEERFPITIEREIHPQGAQGDAASFRTAANHFREMAESFRSELGQLDQKWEGQARDRFFETANALPNKMDAFAETLETMASSIEQKKVTIHETIWVTRDHIYH
jgi:WXG100 family type VII secretion target